MEMRCLNSICLRCHGAAGHRVHILSRIYRVRVWPESRGELWIAVSDHLCVVVLDVGLFIRWQNGIVAQGVVVGDVSWPSSASHRIPTLMSE